MFSARRTTQRAKFAVFLAVVYGVVVALLARFFPAEGASFEEAFLRWLLGIPATLMLWLFLEWFGEKALNLPFWSRIPSVARIALLVLVLAALSVLAISMSTWWHAKSAA